MNIAAALTINAKFPSFGAKARDCDMELKREERVIFTDTKTDTKRFKFGRF